MYYVLFLCCIKWVILKQKYEHISKNILAIEETIKIGFIITRQYLVKFEFCFMDWFFLICSKKVTYQFKSSLKISQLIPFKKVFKRVLIFSYSVGFRIGLKTYVDLLKSSAIVQCSKMLQKSEIWFFFNSLNKEYPMLCNGRKAE